MKAIVRLLIFLSLIVGPSLYAAETHLDESDRIVDEENTSSERVVTHWFDELYDGLPTKQDILALFTYRSFKIVRDNPANIERLPVDFVCTALKSISAYHELKEPLLSWANTLANGEPCNQEFKIVTPLDLDYAPRLNNQGAKEPILNGKFLSHTSGFIRTYNDQPKIINNMIFCWNVDILIEGPGVEEHLVQFAKALSDEHCIVDIFAD